MLQREKLTQAKELMKRSGLDLWVTLIRETGQTTDPIFPLLSTVDFTWMSALIVTKTGRSIALVGNHDAEGTRQTGIFDEVRAYQEDFRPAFARVLDEFEVNRIGLNYSSENPAADGLTHGLYLYISSVLNVVGYRGEVQSSADLIRQLRGQKTALEVERIKGSVMAAEGIFDEAAAFIRQGITERNIFDFYQSKLREQSVAPAWLSAQCPGVMAGPQSVPGHNAPAEISVAAGDVITVDFGVLKEEYCSDLQRVYYVLAADEVSIPEEIIRAFNTVRNAIQEAALAMRPGKTGFEIDQTAREYITSHGYPEWTYALGHEVGRKAHDGGAVLGPRWPRYAGAIDLPIQAGNVFTLELGVPTTRGYVGLEEMILVTEDGAQFLSHPQTTPYLCR